MPKHKLLSCALLAFSHCAFAQQIPSAGSQLQQIPPSPIPPKSLPQVDLGRTEAPAQVPSDDARMRVNRLSITGAQAYPEADLLALTGFQPGREMSLAALRDMASKIADFYHRNGYFVAQAYLPAQDIQEGGVTIAVLEGQYGQVKLNNSSGVSDGLAATLVSGLNPGDAITYAPLENRLLLLSDLPGVEVKSTLTPGASVGTSDLVVDLTPGRAVTGSIDADNAGNRYTGAYRVGATVNLNNLSGQGDVATLRVLTSGHGLSYARASYQMQFGKAKAGVAYSGLRYALGREFESLGAHGTARVASVYGSYPLIRSRSDNLYAQLVYDHKTFHDKLDTTASRSDKTARVLTASVYGDHRDTLGGGGLTAYSLGWTTGQLNLKTTAVQSFDALTARSNGRYNKLGFSASRLQSVTDAFSLYASLNGQVASKNLDVSEKMELGGLYGVRAYPEGEAYADQGYVLTLEARMALPPLPARIPGSLQLVGFVDTGSVTFNRTPWTVGPDRRTLSGAGLGVTWTEPNNFAVRAYYARKLGSTAATSAPDASGRFWVQAVKYF